ncbi:hypothetical protein EDB85DRAFT_1899949 [Lactarius pseudohatsudake]|nr:hypothetical protein EDB85DRAFT_1899949 [Lactarius pseudohatsudake]
MQSPCAATQRHTQAHSFRFVDPTPRTWNGLNCNILHFGNVQKLYICQLQYEKFGSNLFKRGSRRFTNIGVLPNPERNRRSGSGQRPNPNPEPGFGSGKFGFAPKFELNFPITSGEWIDATPTPGTLVINLGDQFARWTNDIFKSTVHRAANRSGERRYSIPLFFGTDYDVLLEPIAGCVSDERPPRYEVTTAGDYVKMRLQATYH